MLAKFGFCLMLRQNVSDKKCSDRQWEFFLKQQNSSSSDTELRYHFMVKERLSSFALSEDTHLMDEDQMVEYQSS